MRYFYTIVLILFISSVSHNAWSQSQTKRTTIKKDNKKKKKESINFEEKLTGDIMVGNLTFFNGLYISSKFTVGYKISDRFSTGLGGKLFYQQISQQGKDPSITDIGSLLFVRGKITSSIYAQAEYNLTAFGDLTQFNLPLPAKTVFYPTIGLGYHSGEGKWSYHAQLLYIANSTAQDYINVVEYWVGAAYNF